MTHTSTNRLLDKAQKRLSHMYQDNINNRFGIDYLLFTELGYIKQTKARQETMDRVHTLFPMI